MFQSLRPNSPIYILHKGDKPYFLTGYVTNVSAPRSKFGMMPNYTNPLELVVDLTVKIDDSIFNYTSIPASADIADSVSGNDFIIITDSKDAMTIEIENLKKKSMDIINSVELNRKLVNDYDKIMGELNPEIALKKSLQEEISSIKTLMAEMSKNMELLMLSNRSLIEQLKPSTI